MTIQKNRLELMDSFTLSDNNLVGYTDNSGKLVTGTLKRSATTNQYTLKTPDDTLIFDNRSKGHGRENQETIKCKIMRRQKKIRNIKYKDIYNLDSTIAKFILPRLKLFRTKTCSYPDGFTFEDWKATLDRMILSFKLVLDTSEPNFGEHKCHIEKINDKLSKLVEDSDSTFDTEAYRKWHKDRQKTIEEGLKLFAEYFQNLWI